MCIFPKGLAHDFDKNLNTLLSLIFLEKDLDIMFNNDLNGKKGFLECINVILT